MITITLDWPDKDLSPNTRQHWTKLAQAKADYRGQCWLMTRAKRADWEGKIPDGDLMLRMTFVPPDNRKRDRDNLIARMKAGIDGLAEALGIDDARFTTICASMRKPGAHPCVLMTITGDDTDEEV